MTGSSRQQRQEMVAVVQVYPAVTNCVLLRYTVCYSLISCVSCCHPQNFHPRDKFLNLLRSPGIDSQLGEIDSLESIPGLLKRLQIRAQALAQFGNTKLIRKFPNVL